MAVDEQSKSEFIAKSRAAHPLLDPHILERHPEHYRLLYRTQPLIPAEDDEYNAFLNERAHVVVEKLSTDNRVQQDTTARYAAELMNYSDFDNRGNIHETLVNSGEILLIRNQGIRDRLRRIEEKYQYINRMENIHFDIIKLRYVPLISEAVDFVDIGVENIERLFDIRIQNLVAILIKVMDEKDMVYKDTVGHIQALISALEDELREN